MQRELSEEIQQLVVDLVAGRYEEIVASGRGGRLSTQELHEAIHSYGRRLIPLPDRWFLLADTYQNDADSDTSSLDVPLWTAEEGRSDLTLSLTAKKHIDRYRVEIDDLHVL